jgi:hypothetical protein
MSRLTERSDARIATTLGRLAGLLTFVGEVLPFDDRIASTPFTDPGNYFRYPGAYAIIRFDPNVAHGTVVFLRPSSSRRHLSFGDAFGDVADAGDHCHLCGHRFDAGAYLERVAGGDERNGNLERPDGFGRLDGALLVGYCGHVQA